jgi:transposase InsO family protein
MIKSLETIHLDPCSKNLGGSSKNLGLVIINDYSHFTWVFFVYDKSEVQGKVKTFIRREQREFGLPIKKVRSDNGSEFHNTNVEEFLDEEGIKHEFSALYTPQQNRVVERKNRTLINMARIILDEYKTLNNY